MRYVRLFLDNTLEIVIAILRIATLLSFGAGAAACFAVIWTYGDDRWVATAVVAPIFGVIWFYLGFYVFGNEEWRRGKADDRATAVRHD